MPTGMTTKWEASGDCRDSNNGKHTRLRNEQAGYLPEMQSRETREYTGAKQCGTIEAR